jgi:hypothetical protein
MVRFLQLTGGNEEIGLGGERSHFFGFLVDAGICVNIRTPVWFLSAFVSQQSLQFYFVLESIPSLRRPPRKHNRNVTHSNHRPTQSPPPALIGP